jgi:WD40 repeat protein
LLQSLLLVAAGMIAMSIVRDLSLWSGLAVTLTGPVLSAVLHAVVSFVGLWIERRFRTRRPVSRDELARTMRISVWLTALVILGLCVAAPWIGTWISYLGVAAAPALGWWIAAEIPERQRPLSRETGRNAARGPQRFGGHGSSVSWLQVTADERRVVSASRQDSQLKVWELSDPEAETHSVGHEADVVAIEPIPGRPEIVTAGMDGRLKIWNLESGANVMTYAGHQRQVTAVSVTADGVRALSASKDEEVVVWNLPERRSELVFRKHKAIVTDVRALSRGRAVSVDLAGVLMVWNVETGRTELQHEFARPADLPNGVSRLAVAPDESFVVGIPRGALAFHKAIGLTLNLDYPATPVIDLASGRLLTELPWMECLCFLTAPTDVLFFAGDRIQRLDLESLSAISLIGHEDEVLDTVVTPDCNRVVSIGRDRTIRCWALDEGRLTRTWIGPAEPTVVALSRDGRMLAAGTRDRKVRAFRLDDLSELTAVTIDGIPRCLSFVESSNRAHATWLVVGDDAGRVYCFDYVSSS